MDGQRDAAVWVSYVSIDMNLCAATTQMVFYRRDALYVVNQDIFRLLARGQEGANMRSQPEKAKEKSRPCSRSMERARLLESPPCVRGLNLFRKALQVWTVGQMSI